MKKKQNRILITIETNKEKIDLNIGTNFINTNLTNTSHSGVDGLTTVDIFDGTFTEEKVDIFANIKRSNKIWLC